MIMRTSFSQETHDAASNTTKQGKNTEKDISEMGVAAKCIKPTAGV